MTTPRTLSGTTRSPSIAPSVTCSRTARPCEASLDLIVLDLAEVLVVEADGPEVAELAETDDLIDLAAELLGGLAGTDRDRDDDALRTLRFHRPCGGGRRRARREPVVDDDRGAPAERDGVGAAAVAARQPVDLRALPRGS